MPRGIVRAAVALLVLLVLIQLMRPEKMNPTAEPALTIYADLHVESIAARISKRSCEDCHSNQTRWPSYSNIAPVSWLVARDVLRGRRALNLSAWERYPLKKKTHELGEICEKVSNGAMPLRIYTLMHREAELSQDNVQAACNWTREAPQALPAAATGSTGR